MPVAIIVATCGPSWGIGLNNSMPWQHKEDTEFFKARTTGNVVIMGRKTYESMGRPLPNRTNIVVSSKKVDHPHVFTADSVDSALDLAQPFGKGDVYVIGGESIYRQFLPYVDIVLRTDIPDNGYKDFDTHFPMLDENEWPCVKAIRLTLDTKVYVYLRSNSCNVPVEEVLSQ